MQCHLLRAIRLCLVLGFVANGPARPEEPAKSPRNRLARESSPYLLQHAHNPVDWYPWCEEAFAKAKKEGKLIFLSIGYSSCHWCHVMERESFENPEVAKMLNDGFVSIKVDREERPDIDAIYMTALSVQGQRGGWPLSMFLTPDGKPIVGGTYWPPDDRDIGGQNVRGFKSILKIMREWQSERAAKLQEQADALASRTREVLASSRNKAIIDLNRTLVTGVVDGIAEEFDKEYGGFGSSGRQFRGPKFPVPSYLLLLLDESGRGQGKAGDVMWPLTLDRMARGGIYDQLGGGFHRYSTERTWTVPHFEKMLYDNAQLVEVYAQAFAQTGHSLYQRIVRETLAFIEREMTSPEGGFYSALDADSNGIEGLSYVWAPAEIAAAIPNPRDAAWIQHIYGVDQPPNFEHKATILTLPKPLTQIAREENRSEAEIEARLAPLRLRLLEQRRKRPQPFLDTKILTGWNGQMIAGYAVAGQALHEPRYLACAERAAQFLFTHLRSADGKFYRTFGSAPGQAGTARVPAYLDDYAYLTHGLLCLHDATGEARWLEQAKVLTGVVIQQFADPDGGGFYYASESHEKLFARSKDQYDAAQPSGNSVMARNLVRLWRKTGEKSYHDLAERLFHAFALPLKLNPTGMTAMAGALALFLDGQAAQPVAGLGNGNQAGGAKKSDAVVKVSAKVDPEKPGPDGKQTVTVTLKIDPGWHVYANPPGLEDLESVQTTLAIASDPKPEDVQVEYPKGSEINDKTLGKYRVYEGETTIKAKVQRAAGATGPLQLTLKFQACNDKQCLLPATKKLEVP